MVELLVSHGADLNGKSVLEESPLGEQEELEGGTGEGGGGLDLLGRLRCPLSTPELGC